MTIKLVCYTDVFASPHAIYDHFVIGIRYSAGICIGNHDYRKLYRLLIYCILQCPISNYISITINRTIENNNWVCLDYNTAMTKGSCFCFIYC